MTKRIEAKVRAFEEAVRAHAWKGASMPEDHEEIEEEYKLRKKQLMNAIYNMMDRNKLGKAK